MTKRLSGRKDKITAATEMSRELHAALGDLADHDLRAAAGTAGQAALLDAAGELLPELQRALMVLAPQRYGSVAITLGRADGIAKFFAFSFATLDPVPFSRLEEHPFWGSGVSAIYYRGKSEAAYAPISRTETPIYVGKADPKDAFAETLEDQGQMLFKRLREHARNITHTELSLDDFHCRAATIQSGMQAAVEEFMIQLFRPIWNKSVGVCHGLGKHGDSATTRQNKRSPWDTMHPGRRWARATLANQAERHEIEARIEAHFSKYPPIRDKAQLLRKLSLVARTGEVAEV